ncbi:MAG: DJ-1/PfpI family protein [Beijerinckiaceae bacterium]
MRAAKEFVIGMIVFDGMTNLDFVAPEDVFWRLPDAKVLALSRDGQPVVSDIGRTIAATHAFGDAGDLDLLFIGGGPGVNALMEDSATLDFLCVKAERAQWITSVCTGALVLGAAGLLRGYRAATHWAAMEALGILGAEPVHERVVFDRNHVTGGGVTAGLDFALAIAARLHGDRVGQTLQLAMEYDPKPPFAGGSPDRADPSITAGLRERLGPITQARIDIARRAAAKFS